MILQLPQRTATYKCYKYFAPNTKSDTERERQIDKEREKNQTIANISEL